MDFIQKRIVLNSWILIVLFLYCFYVQPRLNADIGGGGIAKTTRIPGIFTFLYPSADLQKIKAELNDKAHPEKSQKYQAAVKRLLREADKLLKAEIHTVVEKTVLPPSKDKHDYLSLSTYYWPDPDRPGGLPYVLRDGETNPEMNTIQDKKNFEHMPEQLQVLALAYYYTEKGIYAKKAAAILRAWFVNPETRMNPNLNFAQAVKGRNTGTKSGIIEARELIKLPKAMALLDHSAELKETDQKAVRAWCAEFLDWLLTGKNGKEEGQTLNNHGTWYDALAVALALGLDKKDLADSLLAQNLRRIEVQIEPDGKQPLELKRTKALSYSLFNLEAWLSVGFLARVAGHNNPKTKQDLWDYQTPDGRSIKKALEWVLPVAFNYVQAEKDADAKFGYKQIKPVEKQDLYRLLAAAYALSGDKKYKELISKIAIDGSFKSQEEIENLLYYGLAQ